MTDCDGNSHYTAKGSLGYCHRHYRILTRHGDATNQKRLSPGSALKWLKAAIENETNLCVEWPFFTDNKGYGRVRIDGVALPSSRAALILHTGLNPTELSACHSCHNPKCVNPKHLRWDTHINNMADKVTDGTDHKGEKHGCSKLTEIDVLEIRDRLKNGEPYASISKDYLVSASQIGHIATKKSWSHI